MCAGKLQAIFCRFDKGERGQIPGHKASGRALYGRRAFVHCQLPLEWHAPIASVAALIERLAGCRFGGTPADRTRHCRGAACRSPAMRSWWPCAIKSMPQNQPAWRSRTAMQADFWPLPLWNRQLCAAPLQCAIGSLLIRTPLRGRTATRRGCRTARRGHGGSR